jgi:hypothetical protein
MIGFFPRPGIEKSYSELLYTLVSESRITMYHLSNACGCTLATIPGIASSSGYAPTWLSASFHQLYLFHHTSLDTHHVQNRQSISTFGAGGPSIPLMCSHPPSLRRHPDLSCYIHPPSQHFLNSFSTLCTLFHPLPISSLLFPVPLSTHFHHLWIAR